MGVTITNLQSFGPLTIPLLAGGTVRIPPGERSREVGDVEASANTLLATLIARGIVAVIEVVEPASTDATEKTTRTKGPGKQSSEGDTKTARKSSSTDE